MIIQVLDLFASLARDLGARTVRPMPDGTLRITFAGTAQLRDRTSLIDLAPDARAMVAWHPVPHPGIPGVEGLGGSLLHRGLDHVSVARVALRLAEVCPNWGLDRIRPFSLRTSGPRSFALAPSFVSEVLGSFLNEGGTAWGAFVMEPMRVAPAGVGIRFASPDGAVGVEVRRAADGREGMLIGPVAACLVEDTRSGSLRRPDDRVYDYLLYALHRSIVAGDVVAEPEPAAPPTVAASTHEAVSRSGVEQESAAVPASTPAADAQESMFDPRERIPAWVFVKPPNSRSEGAREVFAAMLDADEGVGLAGHLHVGCVTRMAVSRTPAFLGHMWDGFHDVPIAAPDKPIDITWSTENGVILGQDQEFQAGARDAAARPGTRMVATLCTCFSELLGLGPEDVLVEHGVAAAVPRVAWAALPRRIGDISDFWTGALQLARRDIVPRQGLVNLVGIAPAGSRTAQEITTDLARMGVEVNGFFMPSIRTSHLERFLEASITVVGADRLVERAFARAGEALPGLSTVTVAPPFGPSATLAFYERIARSCSASPGTETADALWNRHRGEWDAWRRRAEGHEVAVVLRSEDVPNLAHPEQMYGIDLIGVLREMGFCIRVACLGSDDGRETATQAAREVEALVAERWPGDGGVAVAAVDRAGAPPDMLASLGSSLVFTEFPPDRRVHDSGRFDIHPRDFQMGLAGSVRTIRRLVRLAEGRFFKVFGWKRRDCAP